MKKILITLFVCVFATSVQAQFIKQGSIIGGGSFDFHTEKVKDSNSKGSSFNLIPFAGYLVMDNLVVGANLEYGSSNAESGSPSNITIKSNSFMFGPLVRYYLDQGLFVHGQYNFGSSKDTYDFGTGETTDKYGKSQIRLGVGYAARITDTVLFEPIIGYYSHTEKDKSTDNKSTTSGIFIMGGFTIILKTVQ